MPVDFTGKWELESSENLENYLKALGKSDQLSVFISQWSRNKINMCNFLIWIMQFFMIFKCDTVYIMEMTMSSYKYFLS